jgi:CheY-like chemotaxis protein
VKVLLIDDEQDFCALFKRSLLRENLADDVDIVHTLEEGLELAQAPGADYEYIFIDLIFPESDAGHTYAKIQTLQMPVVIISGLDKDQFEHLVGPMIRPYRNKGALLQSGGIVGALTELIFSWGNKDRIKQIEGRIHKLEEINGVIPDHNFQPPLDHQPPRLL